MRQQVFRIKSRILNVTLFEISSCRLQQFQNCHGLSVVIPSEVEESLTVICSSRDSRKTVRDFSTAVEMTQAGCSHDR
jgi:hypothetical protein